VPSAGGVPVRVSGGSGSVASPRPAASFVVVSRSSLTSPAEILRVSVDGKSTAALTHENDSWLKDVAFSNPESLTATSTTGQKVQYWLLKPPQFDPAKKYPVVFLIHGGPQGAWD